MIAFFPSTEYAETVSFSMSESVVAKAPTGNLHPDSTYSDNAHSASISVLDFASSIFFNMDIVFSSSALQTIASAP